ncbi:hypothetical protein IMCC3135_28870 [Granulosicoccus antarcticus IMCC3135]|uniref:Uncharacterized protein n=2 Tax=Granulosicoccus TaxID=437504 RepID=A0A2Z2NWJ0_9GAMM|nr:hypothetical protein IMCC3135_28870 [Granulosicoccus antarcticus IMCC3135]
MLHSCKNEEKHENTSRTATEASAAETTVIAKTDITKLQSITSIPGDVKAVWWAGEAMGTPGNDRVPGPTDIFLRAVIDYGSAEVVAQMLKTVDGKSEQVSGASWYPELLGNLAAGEGDLIPVKEYKNVPGFHPNALIRVPEGLSSYVILAQVLG